MAKQFNAGIDGGHEHGTDGDSSHSRHSPQPGITQIQHSPNDHGRAHRREHAPHPMNADHRSGSATSGALTPEQMIASAHLSETDQNYRPKRGGGTGKRKA